MSDAMKAPSKAALKARAVTKRKLAALEKLFAAEIDGRLPFQSKARVFEELVSEQMAEESERIIGAGERFPVKVRGYELTHLGRLFYCGSCVGIEVAR
jgi:hypothetical protein